MLATCKLSWNFSCTAMRGVKVYPFRHGGCAVVTSIVRYVYSNVHAFLYSWTLHRLGTSSEMLSGVPQGTILAPLLFTWYVNDIPSNQKLDYMQMTSCCLYTDEDCLALQEDLNALIRWSYLWLMSFNPSKCVHLTDITY